MSESKYRFDTDAVHAGDPEPIGQAVTLPIFQSSTFTYHGPGEVMRYLRMNNSPNHEALNEKIATLEKTEAAEVFASGMAAISTAVLALTNEGEEILTQDSLYGGTYGLFKDHLPSLGRRLSYFKIQDPDSIEKKITPKTKVLYVESTSNPLLEIPDFEKIVSIAKKNKLVTVIDNTFPSPHNFNPATLGFDVIAHSATKYMNGHSDIVAGALAGRADLIAKIHGLAKILGATLDPHACFLLARGMKTLGVRMRQHNESALFLAKALSQHPKVKRVIYPGLENHPDHQRAKKYFKGFGGMLSFEIKGTVAEADAMLKRLKFAFVAASLGGVETLVTRPAITSHHYLSAEDRQKVGVTDELIRVSVGLEDAQDLRDDFVQALG